ncbi:hypothetical protein BLNAU_4754 [Blattamonas nauphoetae]|uniref:Ubiquitin-like domain-containing protein n=1 Tax=Blattamonas nauphoetae TaxID=2049346 RepID=A0ABQ9Y923_9EUKA|nr:hypothetical protein BLNAU_4754 [Blattamonas nauphoetae]
MLMGKTLASPDRDGLLRLDIDREKRIGFRLQFIKRIEEEAMKGNGIVLLYSMLGIKMTSTTLTYLLQNEQFEPPRHCTPKEKEQWKRKKRQIENDRKNNGPMCKSELRLKERREIMADKVIDTLDLSKLPTGPFLMYTVDQQLGGFKEIHFLNEEERISVNGRHWSDNAVLDTFVKEIVMEQDEVWMGVFGKRDVKEEMEGKGKLDPAMSTNPHVTTNARLLPLHSYRLLKSNKERFNELYASKDGKKNRPVRPRFRRQPSHAPPIVPPLVPPPPLSAAVPLPLPNLAAVTLPLPSSVGDISARREETRPISEQTQAEMDTHPAQPESEDEKEEKCASEKQPSSQFIVMGFQKQATHQMNQPNQQAAIVLDPLKVSVLDGRHFQIAYEENKTIETVVAEIESKTGHTFARSTLKKSNRALKPKKTLIDEGVSPGDHLVITWKMKAGNIFVSGEILTFHQGTS